jgi:septal ring factor EnvC (AmiA/AmiB activator)
MHLMQQIKSIENEIGNMEHTLAVISSELSKLKTDITTLTEAKYLVEKLHKAFQEEDHV